LIPFYAIALLIALIPGIPVVLSAPLVVVALSFVPGTLILALVTDNQRVDASFVVTALGLSLLTVMITGVVMNLLLLPLKINRPLSAGPLSVSISVIVGFTALILSRSDRPAIHIPAGQTDLRRFMLLALLPLWSISSVTILNRTGYALPIIVVLSLVAVIPFIATFVESEDWHAFGIWSLATAILYHDSLYVYSGFGGSPGVVTAWEAGRWTPGIEEAGPTSITLLENGVLFPAFARLAGVNVLTQMEVINPFFVSFIPITMYVTFRRFVESDVALLGSSIFVFAHPFYLQYPTAGRAATPVLFLVLLGMVATDERLDLLETSFLSLLFATGIITTHYGTAYYVLAAVVIATILGLSYQSIDSWVSNKERKSAARLVSDVVRSQDVLDCADGRTSAFSWTFLLFYGAVAIAWYMYSVEGAKFKLLPNHASRVLNQLVQGTIFVGGSTQRIQRSYGGEAISMSKTLYILLAVLIMLGLMVAHYKRFWSETKPDIDDSFLALSTGLFGLFSITVLFQTWGGGRPLMIAFSFTALFAVLGFLWVNDRVISVFDHCLSSDTVPISNRTAKSGFALLLIVFFLLNSGVASAVALDGRAPSNVPLHPEIDNSTNPSVRSDGFRVVDTQTHVWINNHHTRTRDDWGKVYADTTGSGQTDWYRPRIEMLSDGHSAYYEWWKPRGELHELAANRSRPGYVLLMGHNTEMRTLTIGNSEQIPLKRVRPALSTRSRIYTTGDTNIYFGNETSVQDSNE
jgi:uncharacterized membrane protein